MENALMKSPVAGKYLPAKVNLQQLQRIDEVTADFYEIVTADEKSPAAAIIRAAAMQQLRELLTDDVMQPIMALQGNKLGFLTDRDRKKGPNGMWIPGDGYPIPVIRDVTIWAAGNGARMVNNEVNILAGNGYLTLNFFDRKLDDILGAENWSIIPEIPRITKSAEGKIGAVVTGALSWRDSAGEHTQSLTLAIKGDEYASADAYLGKFRRKAGKFILERCTGQRYADGDAADVIEATATEIEEERPRKSPLESRRAPKNASKTEQPPQSDGVVEPEIVSAPAVEPPQPAAPPKPQPAAPPKPQPAAPPKPQPAAPAGEPTSEELLAAELTRRGEFITVETMRNFAFDNGFEFDAEEALKNLDMILDTIRANGGK